MNPLITDLGQEIFSGIALGSIYALIALGFILIFLHLGTKPTSIVEGIEYIATKIGIVLLALGGMHFFNMFNFDRMRKKGNRHVEWKKAAGTPAT